MCASNGFQGAWRVSEYVFNPDGGFAGVVRQRRELRQRADGDIDVVQGCSPGPELAGHPMAGFRGERVFRLRMDGRVRRYLGPDVIGSGLTWGAGALTGRGVWPQFGHNFTSFSIMVAPDRQITGGQFFNAGEMVANIIGLAVPEGSGADYPEFYGPSWPADIGARWVGSRREVDGAGAIVAEAAVEREYRGDAGYAEADFTLTLANRGSRWSASGTLTGIAKRTGWMLETAGVSGESFVQVLDVLDPQGGNLVSLRRWMRDESVASVEVLRLRPISP